MGSGKTLGGIVLCAAMSLGAVVATQAGGQVAALAGGQNAQKPAPPPAATKPVNLGTAGFFVILSKAGITDVYPSVVTGDVGTSPISGTADLLSCTEVTGRVFSVDAAGPVPCNIMDPSRLTTAVGDMGTAYTDAAGRSAKVAMTNLDGGVLVDKTLGPGVYSWTTAVLIPTNLTLRGSSKDVWIFKIAGTLDISSAKSVILSGGAAAKNVFWQVADRATLGTTSHFEGIILSGTGIDMRTGASINGRLFAQTDVTLQSSTVKQPK